MATSWSNKRKALLGAGGLIIVAAMVVLNLQKESKTESSTQDAETLPVRRGSVVEQLKETGRIEFVRTVEVKSTVSGEIVHLFAEAGDAVSEGDMLAIIRPDPNQTLQLYNKRAAVERARIDLDRVRKDLARKEALKKRNLIAEEEIERIRDQFEKALNAYQLAQLELETLVKRSNIQQSKGSSSSARLDNVRVLAPASGIVIARPVEIGEVVVSGILSTVTGTKLFEIGDPSLMMVKAYISEVDVGRLAPGQSVHIIADAYPDTTYRGEVYRIAPVGQIRQGSNIVSFETEIRVLDREPRLRQGMSCDVDIVFARRDSALYLPLEAVYEDFGDDVREGDKKGIQGRFVVFVKEDTFVVREIQVGLKSDVRVEVLSGVTSADSVAADAEKLFKERAKESDE